MSDKTKNINWSRTVFGTIIGSIPGVIYFVITALKYDKPFYLPALIIALGGFFLNLLIFIINTRKNVIRIKNEKLEIEKQREEEDLIAKKAGEKVPIRVSSVVGNDTGEIKMSFLEEILSIIVSIAMTYVAYIISITLFLNRMFEIGIFKAFLQAFPLFFEKIIITDFIICAILILFIRLILLLRSKFYGF